MAHAMRNMGGEREAAADRPSVKDDQSCERENPGEKSLQLY
jgi:hypothetical protein